MRILIFLLLLSYLANAQVCDPVNLAIDFTKTPNTNSLCDYRINVAWNSWGNGETFVIENTDISCSNQVPVSDGEVELICEADCNEEVCFIYSVLNANNEICFQKTECYIEPVSESLYFSAEFINKKVLLLWKSTDIGAQKFIIEHSINNLTWKKITTKSVQTNIEQYYKYVHKKSVQGDNYYRITQILENSSINTKTVILTR